MVGTDGRAAQKERTRMAILDGARRLLSEGKPVTVAAAAEVHNISKATAYRYFSDPALLVAEAGLDVRVAPYEDVTAGCPDLRAKLKAISLYFLDLAFENEAGFRQFVSMSLAAWTPDESRTTLRRGARRVRMYEQALASEKAELPDGRRQMLVHALTMATGTEAMIALLDIAHVDHVVARETVSDVVDAILDHYLGRQET
ncbi:hypothetical protein HKCCE4037_00445 [Rhodobacterales bacterium HKCCE4037]|nr:hypothetical protein [Rhodobacterales bacterium HKCCE4037]